MRCYARNFIVGLFALQTLTWCPASQAMRLSDAFLAPEKGESLLSLAAGYDSERQQEILMTSLLAFDYEAITTGMSANYSYGLNESINVGLLQNYIYQRAGNVNYSATFEGVGAKDYQPIWRGPMDTELTLASVLGPQWQTNFRARIALTHSPKMWHSIQATSGGDGTMGRGGPMNRASLVLGHTIYDIFQFSGGLSTTSYGDRNQISAKGTTNYTRKGGNIDHYFAEVRFHPSDAWAWAVSFNKTSVKESTTEASTATESSTLTVSPYEYQYFRNALWWMPSPNHALTFESSSPSPGTITILDGGISGKVTIERFEYRLGWTARL